MLFCITNEKRVCTWIWNEWQCTLEWAINQQKVLLRQNVNFPSILYFLSLMFLQTRGFYLLSCNDAHSLNIVSCRHFNTEYMIIMSVIWCAEVFLSKEEVIKSKCICNWSYIWWYNIHHIWIYLHIHTFIYVIFVINVRRILPIQYSN